MNEHARPALDERLDLRLPLFGPHETGCGQQREHFLRTAGAAEQLVERTVRGNAFATFSGENEQAAGADDACARAHAFHALIQIHVERIAAVGGDDDIEGLRDRLHRGLADEFNSALVRRDQVAGKDAGDLTRFIERDVEEEARPDAQGDVAHFLPDRISFGDAKRGLRIADVALAVVAHHGVKIGDTGHDAFRSAAEAGEEMRFNKTGDNPHVGVGKMFVDQGRFARAGDAELNVRVGVVRLVIEHAIIRHDFGREHFFQFGFGVGTMGAKRVEQGDVFARHVGQMREQPRNEPVIRRGAGDVGEDDAHAVGGLDLCEERLGRDGIFERANDGGAFVRQTGRMRRHDDGGTVVGKFDGQVALAVSKFNFHKPGKSSANRWPPTTQRRGWIRSRPGHQNAVNPRPGSPPAREREINLFRPRGGGG